MSDDVESFGAELLCIEVRYQGSGVTIVLDGALDMTGAERFVACVVDVLETHPESIAVAYKNGFNLEPGVRMDIVAR